MRVLIDGHNALFALHISGPTHEQQRHALLRLVSAVAPEATVYFDARDAPSDAFSPASELGVRVVYCKRREADAAILDEVRGAAEPRRILVVTNDREVRGVAAQHGAQCRSVSEFFRSRRREPNEGGEDPARRSLRGRLRFKPSDFGLPDHVDLDNPDRVLRAPLWRRK